MKTLLALSVALISNQALACLPHMPSIEHGIAMGAIQAVFKESHASVMELQEKKIENLRFAWINRDAGYMCHDRDTATVRLTYKNEEGKTTQYTVEIQRDEGKVTSTKVTPVAQ